VPHLPGVPGYYWLGVRGRFMSRTELLAMGELVYETSGYVRGVLIVRFGM
jgi:hypothetical protein